MRKCIIAPARNVSVALELYLHHDVSPRGLRYFGFEPSCSCEIMHLFLTLPVPYAE
jgi:hypothetical protein